jgi:multidrug resistance efflux pump
MEWVMANISGQIDALEQRLKQLKAKQQQSEARRRSLESRRARRDDLRRKILVGAVVLAKVEDGGFQRATLNEWLDAALTRADDRGLFGLGPHDGGPV